MIAVLGRFFVGIYFFVHAALTPGNQFELIGIALLLLWTVVQDINEGRTKD